MVIDSRRVAHVAAVLVSVPHDAGDASSGQRLAQKEAARVAAVARNSEHLRWEG